MKRYKKILAVVLVAAILTTSLFFYFRGRQKDKEADNINVNLEDFFDGEIKNAVLDNSKPLLPEREYITSDEAGNGLTLFQKFLVSDEVTYQKLLAEPQLENHILNAVSLSGLIQSKKETEGLKKLSGQIHALLEQEINNPEITEIFDSNTTARLEKIKLKLDKLFMPAEASEEPANPIQGTWTTPDRIILRWAPEDDWIPEKGYNLYRTLSGKTELIAEGLGNAAGLDYLAELNLEFSPYVKELFQVSLLDTHKKNLIGVSSEKDFYELVYKEINPYTISPIISGKVDFALEKERLFTVHGNIENKIPLSDTRDNYGVRFVEEIKARPVLLNEFRQQDTFINTGMIGNLNLQREAGEISEKISLANEILDARNSILTKVFVNEEFANATGFGYEDNLGGLDIDPNTAVRYVVVPLSGANESITVDQVSSGSLPEDAFGIEVAYGVEELVETPRDFEGYGADNTVHLRWNAPQTEYAREIVSGYYIERRKKDETSFAQINDVPVAISYSEDDSGILFETPAMYIDEDVKNGDELAYRVHAIDIFGRTSAYSTELDIKVYKVTPPQQPILGEPSLSVRERKRADIAHRQLFDINSGTNGISLPLARTTSDTEVFVIYRSKVFGNGHFGIPEELVRLNFLPFIMAEKPVLSENGFNAVFLINPQTEISVDALYYDNSIEPGYYYKYWVSAVDSWGNESAWSESKVIGFPLETPPTNPVNPVASMKKNPDVSEKKILPPGFYERYVQNTAATLDLDDLPFQDGKIVIPSNIGLFGNQDDSAESEPGTAGAEDSAEGDEDTGNTACTGLSGLKTALAENSNFKNGLGYSLSDLVRMDVSLAPEKISLEYNNLPKPKDIHDIILLSDGDFSQGNNAGITWQHYSGAGLSGYAVYRAYADNVPAEALRRMTEEEVLEAFEWNLVISGTTLNHCSDKVERKSNRLYVYMVCLIPESTGIPVSDLFNQYASGGWVHLGWQRPDDAQVSYYRVYRAEVPYFKENEDFSSLEWSMVEDSLRYKVYSEKVDQTFAHYYYYKVTSVSVWGVESEEGSITGCRISATVPPQAPTMLVPFSKKEVNQVNWMGVSHASKYIIYRKKLPRISDLDLSSLYISDPSLFDRMFNTEQFRDIYSPPDTVISSVMTVASTDYAASGLTIPSRITQNMEKLKPSAIMTNRFKTIQNMESSTFVEKVSGIPIKNRLAAFQSVIDKYGILSVLSYNSLDIELAATVIWEIAGEVDISLGEDSSGKREFFDSNVQFGETYLYTVQAMNDDKLYSDRPEPVSVFTRKGEAFPPVTNLRWEIYNGNIRIFWDSAKDPNLTVEESQEYIAGYLVYRSNTKEGDYYQASSLINYQKTFFSDVYANPGAENWYKVKVVDTAGFMSEFSEPILAATKPADILPESMFFDTIGRWDVNNGIETDRDVTDYSEVIASAEDVMSVRIPIPVTPTPRLLVTITPAPTPQGRATSTPTPTPRVFATPTPRVFTTVTPTPTPPVAATPTPRLMVTVTPAPTPSVAKPLEVMPLVVISDTMKMNGFEIAGITLAGKISGTGEGVLRLREYSVPVDITINKYQGDTITEGYLSLKNPSKLGDTGIHFTELSIKTTFPDAVVTGYIKRQSGNLIGDLNVLNFQLSTMVPAGIIHIYGMPVFHYENLTVKRPDKITVNFGNQGQSISFTSDYLESLSLQDRYGNAFINLHSGFIETKLGLESTDNKGIEYKYTTIAFNRNGELEGRFLLNGEKTMPVVIPAGLGIKVTSSVLQYSNGKVDVSKSYINGRVLTPFETFDDLAPVNLDALLPSTRILIDQETLEALNKAYNSGNSGSSGSLGTSGSSGNNWQISQKNISVLNSSLYYISQRVQSDALLVFPDDPAARESLSHLPFSIQNWDGCGFMVQDTAMTPSNIPLYDPNKLKEEELEAQKDAKLGITPGRVALDLRRDSVYEGESPQDTKDPEWMGIVVKYGNVSLPPAFVQTEQNGRIRFNLTAGELLYDQNGFCYQNQAYTPEGVPAVFGSKLGDFRDVLVRNVVLDLYNNIADLEIEADLAVPLFHCRIKVKMLRDDDSGLFVCNVAETEKFDPAGDGKVKIKVLGGYLDEAGMHLDGTMDLFFGDEGEDLSLSDAQFNEFIIPSDMTLMLSGKNPGIYGRALFDKPYRIEFHKFPMEVRSISVTSNAVPLSKIETGDYTGPRYYTSMSMWGGMQLSDNLTLNANEDPDTIMLRDIFYKPVISYDESHSEVVMNFEEFADITGTGKPIKSEGDFVEYDTSGFQFAFNAVSSLTMDSAFDINARIGYDKARSRSYFAVAMYYTGSGIPFGYGEIRNMGGMMGYNMEMAMNPDGTYQIPDNKNALLAMVDNMDVNTGGGNYFFAAACTVTMGYGGLSLGELRDVYLIVEKGPTVEMGGSYYGPDSIDDFTGSGSFKMMGTAAVGYYHRQRMFKFSISLYDFGMYGLSVSGDLGFEMSPDFWELRVGYPETLTAKAGIFQVGFGLGIRDSDIDESFIKAKAHYGFDTGKQTIGIVYVRAYLMVGGEGYYSSNLLMLSVYVQGGVEGGVRAMGKTFKVIHLMLDARGELAKKASSKWSLDANARISYHVNLKIKKIKGSVSWHIHTSF